MKKLQLLFTLFALPLVASGPSNDDLQREIDQLKLRVDRLSNGSEMPVEPTSSSGMGFCLSADLLFWQTQSDYITYGLQSSQSFGNVIPQSNQLHEVDIDWAWGFRVGAGYQFAHDNWKLLAEYTYLRPRGSSSRSIANDVAGSFPLSSESEGIQSNWNSGQTLAAKIAKSNYKLNYDYVTLQLAKNFCISSHIDFSTHMGLAAGWMSEHITTTFTGGTLVGFLDTSTLLNQNDNDFWGIGPVAGMGAFWNLGLGFSIFGDVTSEILVGKNRTSSVEQVNGSSTDYVKLIYDGYKYRPQLFMQIGLAYDAYFNDAAQHLGIRAGWENQVWFNQMVGLSESQVEQYGDIQFSGLTVKALFAF